jgi:hypothetical protein
METYKIHHREQETYSSEKPNSQLMISKHEANYILPPHFLWSLKNKSGTPKLASHKQRR